MTHNSTAKTQDEHKGLIVKIAKGYVRDTIELEDLIAEGYIGLLEAQKTYQAEKGAFTTHAYYQIRRRIVEHARAFSRAGKAFESREGRAEFGANKSTIPHDLRLDAIDGEGRPVGENLIEDSTPSALAVLIDSEPVAFLRAFGANLTDPREQGIWANFMADEPMSMEELGASYGVTKQRISQIALKLKQRAQKALAGA